MFQLRAMVLAFIGIVVPACGWWTGLQEERNRNLQLQHASSLLSGYSDFETLMFDTDTWLMWYQYRLPDGMDAAAATAAIAKQILAQRPCFEVQESAAYEIRIRCAQPEGRSFEEYLIATLPEERKALVMYASIDSEAELVGYPSAVQDFRETSRRGATKKD
jgi:hypothetical protein